MQIGRPFIPYKIFVGSFIPNCLMMSPDFSPGEKLVWARLAQYGGKNGHCFPKVERLAKSVGLSWRRTMDVLRTLEEKGMITRVHADMMKRFEGDGNQYQFLWHPVFEQEFTTPDDDEIPPSSHMSFPTGGGIEKPLAHMSDPTYVICTEENQSLNTICPNSQIIEKSIRTIHPEPTPDIPPVDPLEEFLPLAHQLANIIQSNKRITIPLHQRQSWALSIRRLCSSVHINPGRVKRALDWYADHAGEPYVPVIESGQTLRDKFLKLEAAIERDHPGNNRGQRDTRPTQSQHEVIEPNKYANVRTYTMDDLRRGEFNAAGK